MKEKLQNAAPPAAMPDRAELQALPRAPRLIMDVARQLRYRVRRGEEPGVMSQHAARVLMAHLAVCGEASQLTLAEKTHFSTPTVSILLRKMEGEGYVCRRPDQHDRRVMLVALTEKGHAFDREHLNLITENDRCAMQGFTPAEEEQLAALLQRVYENLKER
ncbi:MAG: winged helix-turn-helix transcriptional regulator [Clostridia bacterium]|nr:winged helix-turn-helix transcriptional regulator [Clostridia bacterium]